MKKIILCSTQRSGSTMVVEDMRNSEVLGNPEEYFIKWQSLGETSDIQKEIEILHNQGEKNDVFSIKVMASQIKKVNELLKNSTQFNDITELFQGAHWVYIKRNNTIKQAVSKYIASVTKINHAISDETSNHFVGNLLKGNHSEYNKNVPYDYNKIFQEYIHIRKENLFWEEFFVRFNIEPLVLEYEIYSKYENYKHLYDIANHAQISEKLSIKERKLKKLSNDVNKLFVESFKNDIFERYYL